jgi:hypothetical protein
MGTPTKEQRRKLVRKAQQDPVWWIENVLGVELWSKQRDIAESVRDNPETSCASCHSGGKTFVAAAIALWFLYAHSPSIVITTAPTGRQVSKLLWKDLRVLYAKATQPLGGRLYQTQELKLADDRFAVGFSTKDYDPNAIQGWHSPHLLAILDEACGIAPFVQEGIDGVLSGAHTRKLEIGNPVDPTSAFADSFKRPDVKKIWIDAFDTPNFTHCGITEQNIVDGSWRELVPDVLPAPHLVTPGWVARMAGKWGVGSSLWQARVRGQFPQEGTDTLIPLHQLIAAQQRQLMPSKPIELAADIARLGDDHTIIGWRRGPHARVLQDIPKCTTTEATGAIVNHQRKCGASAIKIDADGLGAGVYDQLIEQGHPAIEMRGGMASSDPEQYVNARSEWYWNLRERAESGDLDLDPEDEELVSQLSQIKWKLDSRGRIAVESKDEMRKRGLSSPDRADWLAYNFGQPASKVVDFYMA